MHQGHPTTNVSKYARNVSDGFLYALEACLVHLDCPKNVLSVRMSLYLFRWLFRLIRKVLATLTGLVESLGT